MGSVENGSMNEFDDESLYSPETEAQKTTHPVQVTEPGTHSEGPQAHIVEKKKLGNVAYKSIKDCSFLK